MLTPVYKPICEVEGSTEITLASLANVDILQRGVHILNFSCGSKVLRQALRAVYKPTPVDLF